MSGRGQFNQPNFSFFSVTSVLSVAKTGLEI